MAAHIADLVAFVKPADLPPSLAPFVNQRALIQNDDIRVAVFKIMGTIDSYYGIPIRKGTTVNAISTRIMKDLAVVKLADDTAALLGSLLERFKAGEFAHLLRHEIDKKHPYRH